MLKMLAVIVVVIVGNTCVSSREQKSKPSGIISARFLGEDGWGDCTGGPLIFRAFSTLVHVTDVGVLRLGVRVGLEWRAADTSHRAGAGLALPPSTDALCGARTNEEPLTPRCWCLFLGGNQPMTQSGEVSAAGTGGPARQSTVNESDGGEQRSALSGIRAAVPWRPAPRSGSKP